MSFVPMTRDGCEWNPDADRAVYENEPHYLQTQAEVIVGADGQYRLCASCAKLPRFRRFRVRKTIERRTVREAWRTLVGGARR